MCEFDWSFGGFVFDVFLWVFLLFVWGVVGRIFFCGIFWLFFVVGCFWDLCEVVCCLWVVVFVVLCVGLLFYLFSLVYCRAGVLWSRATFRAGGVGMGLFLVICGFVLVGGLWSGFGLVVDIFLVGFFGFGVCFGVGIGCVVWFVGLVFLLCL